MKDKRYYNALTFNSDINTVTGSEFCSTINYVGSEKQLNTNSYIDIDVANVDSKRIYISDIMDEQKLDKAIELSSNCDFMLNLSMTLYDVGACDKKFGKTPIALAHSLGLLDNSLIAGCNYIDKDDIDLMVQSNASAIILPSYSLGNGFGIPPLRMMLSRGLRIHIGTADNEYNRSADMQFEGELIRLAVCGNLCTRDAVTSNEIKSILFDR